MVIKEWKSVAISKLEHPTEVRDINTVSIIDHNDVKNSITRNQQTSTKNDVDEKKTLKPYQNPSCKNESSHAYKHNFQCSWAGCDNKLAWQKKNRWKWSVFFVVVVSWFSSFLWNLMRNTAKLLECDLGIENPFERNRKTPTSKYVDYAFLFAWWCRCSFVRSFVHWRMRDLFLYVYLANYP